MRIGRIHDERCTSNVSRVTHPFHPLRGRVFRLIEYRQAWGEYRVFFDDNSGELARLPRQWTDLVPDALLRAEQRAARQIRLAKRGLAV
jgi:hypothetical protein